MNAWDDSAAGTVLEDWLEEMEGEAAVVSSAEAPAWSL